MSLPFVLAGEILKPQPWDTLLAIGVVATLALVPLAIKAGTLVQERRTRRIRAEFGDEYDQAVDHFGDWRAAEAALIARARAGLRRDDDPHRRMLDRTAMALERAAGALIAPLRAMFGRAHRSGRS